MAWKRMQPKSVKEKAQSVRFFSVFWLPLLGGAGGAAAAAAVANCKRSANESKERRRN